MNISNYADFFHDGSVCGIEHTKSKMVLALESAELLPEWNKDNIPLSKNNTIAGKLHLEECGRVRINDQIYNDLLVMTHDSAEIYDFFIKKTGIMLVMRWKNYPPKPREETPFSKYEIEAEHIFWENIPDLFDET